MSSLPCTVDGLLDAVTKTVESRRHKDEAESIHAACLAQVSLRGLLYDAENK